MKLYAIKFENEAIKEGDRFKSLGCAISAITHFDGRVVEGVDEGLWTDTTHAGKTGMELKLWWAEQQKSADLLMRALPFLRDTANEYEDDGSNEPLELARDIEQHITLTEGGAA